MVPVIALVGRPNVGKSTLFNRLTKSRDALVVDIPGVTRDRQYGHGVWNQCEFVVIDTGGIATAIDDELVDLAQEQTEQAIEEADFIFFIVDGQVGITAADEIIAERIRKHGKSVTLVINKAEAFETHLACAEFYELGIGQPYAISAKQGRGVNVVMDDVFADFVIAVDTIADPDHEASNINIEEGDIKFAIVGRPNVGKSTLVNRMLGEDRVVVYDEAGTTTDSIFIPFEHQNDRYTIIDTAGIRRKSKVHKTLEKFSVIKTLQAIQEANVVLLMIDARDGIVDQDKHLLGFILESGKSLIIVVNKWDGLESDQKVRIKSELDRQLSFIDYAEIYFVSAKHGTGVGNLYPSIKLAYESAMCDMPTPLLTEILSEAVELHPPPVIRSRRIKLRYAHAGGHNPPRIIIHGNQLDALPNAYRRYLANTYRKVLNLYSTPVHIELKTGANPYARRRNRPNDRPDNNKHQRVIHYRRRGK